MELKQRRRAFILIAVISASIILLTALFGCSSLYDRLGGNFSEKPQDFRNMLSQNALKLVDEAFRDIPEGGFADHHVHIVGKGSGIGSFCSDKRLDSTTLYLNPKRLSWTNPLLKVKTEIFRSASGARNFNNANEQFVARLFDLVKHFGKRGTFYILALDGYYELDGTINWENTDFLIPNDYALALADCLNRKLGAEQFVPVISIHPYRKDALERLDYYADRGVRVIKWLPNAMNIDPSRKENINFYKKLIERKIVLLTHTGKELSLNAPKEKQSLGNPLGFKLPLDLGVTIVMSHLGNHGVGIDEEGNRTENYQLFFQLLEEAERNGKWRLYGDLSAVVLKDTVDNLKAIFNAPHLWNRVVNGSDYPLPAIKFLNNTARLKAHGFLTQKEVEALNEIYDFNPLLFDFVLKRTLKNPDDPKVKLPPQMFESIFSKISSRKE